MTASDKVLRDKAFDFDKTLKCVYTSELLDMDIKEVLFQLFTNFLTKSPL